MVGTALAFAVEQQHQRDLPFKGVDAGGGEDDRPLRAYIVLVALPIGAVAALHGAAGAAATGDTRIAEIDLRCRAVLIELCGQITATVLHGQRRRPRLGRKAVGAAADQNVGGVLL